MVKDCDELKDLFRSRLAGAERPVREGFWEELQAALPPARGGEVGESGPEESLLFTRSRKMAFTRWFKVAASLLLLLGFASALLWLTQPQGESLTLALSAEEKMDASLTQQLSDASSIHKGGEVALPAATTSATQPLAPQIAVCQQRGSMANEACRANLPEDKEELVHVQVTIRIQEQGYIPHTYSLWQRASSDVQQISTSTDNQQSEGIGLADVDAPRQSHPSMWALKAGVGSALYKGDAHLPFTASLTVERRVHKQLAVEAGIRYNCLPHRGTTYHTIQLPARLQCLLAASDQVAFYALAGGSAEKCVAGAPSNSFSEEPVRWAVEGGVGVRYRLSDRLALFAEPTVSHHFSTDSANRSLRTERPTNFNLICGLRVNY
ncbi:MAG: porin family protein [Bacteroides sp.]